MTPRKLLILGNSAAAISAVNAIRGQGCDWPITLVSREACEAYSPVLTTHYLRGAIEEEGLFVCDASFYLQGYVQRRFGHSVVELDSKGQTVVLDDGERIGYDVLLIATGASPKRVEQVDADIASEICYLRTIEDARRIRELARRARHIVVVGGGLVSLQVATAIARLDLSVTCVVTSQQVLSQNVDQRCASLIRRHAERSANISFLLGTSAQRISREGTGYRVALDTGEVLRADMVVAGKGISPNVDFLDRREIDVRTGILVDDHLRTSVKNVFAAGDLAEGRNRITGEIELVPNWINACEQGRIAGRNMVGGEESFEGSVTENMTTVFGLPVASIGVTRVGADDPELREVTYSDEERNLYRKLVLKGDRPIGALLLRDIEDAGVLRDSIVRGSDLPLREEDAARSFVTHADVLRRCLYGKSGTEELDSRTAGW
ncbi:MAG: FAD-dependent oxidoreductase [bacterium]